MARQYSSQSGCSPLCGSSSRPARPSPPVARRPVSTLDPYRLPVPFRQRPRCWNGATRPRRPAPQRAPRVGHLHDHRPVPTGGGRTELRRKMHYQVAGATGRLFDGRVGNGMVTTIGGTSRAKGAGRGATAAQSLPTGRAVGRKALAHYVDAYQVRLPAEVTTLMTGRPAPRSTSTPSSRQFQGPLGRLRRRMLASGSPRRKTPTYPSGSG
jgi:hypothetical protein